MIDIPLDDISTHKIPEQSLISAVVALAVRDACIPPFKDEKHLKMAWDCTTAHDFLWTESLDSYLHWLNIDVEYFRRNLIKTMGDDSEKTIGLFYPKDRRAFRINKKLWEHEYERLGGRVASSSSKNWHTVEGVARKGFDESPRNLIRYSNGIEAIVQYHKVNSGN
jgi:hypothetical protein